MCGKFTQMYTWAQVHAFSTPITIPAMATPPEDAVRIVTPMRMASVLHIDDQGARQTTQMRWGFADRNAANPARPKHMHARAETIDTRPTFADSFRARRGLLLVRTFNEGEELPNGKTRQWVITPNDGAPLALAVIYEDWVNGDETLTTFIQVTVPANVLISPVTDRMPAILPAESWPAWLGETDASLADIKALLQTFEDDGAWSIAPQEPPPKKPKAAKPTQSDLL